jgi:hypothetical protein
VRRGETGAGLGSEGRCGGAWTVDAQCHVVSTATGRVAGAVTVVGICRRAGSLAGRRCRGSVELGTSTGALVADEDVRWTQSWGSIRTAGFAGWRRVVVPGADSKGDRGGRSSGLVVTGLVVTGLVVRANRGWGDSRGLRDSATGDSSSGRGDCECDRHGAVGVTDPEGSAGGRGWTSCRWASATGDRGSVRS